MGIIGSTWDRCQWGPQGLQWKWHQQKLNPYAKMVRSSWYWNSQTQVEEGWTLTGSWLALFVGWWPLTTIQKSAGPGVRSTGQGVWVVCRVINEWLLVVYVLLSYRCPWPMCIVWVANLPQVRMIVVLLAAALEELVYEVVGMTTLMDWPPHKKVIEIPLDWGWVVAEKVGRSNQLDVLVSDQYIWVTDGWLSNWTSCKLYPMHHVITERYLTGCFDIASCAMHAPINS